MEYTLAQLLAFSCIKHLQMIRQYEDFLQVLLDGLHSDLNAFQMQLDRLLDLALLLIGAPQVQGLLLVNPIKQLA